MVESNDLGVGVIGCGWAGRNAAKQITRVTRARLVGIFDMDAQAAQEHAAEYNVPAYTELEQMLTRSDLDAIMIGSPQFAHKEQVLAAAAHGKHIFCEKPMALSLSDCDEMIAAANRANVKFCVGQVLRLLVPYVKCKELIESEELGSPLGVAIARCGGPFGPAGHWRTKQSLSGGTLFEFSVHELDFMRHLAGEPEEVFAQSQQILTPSPSDYPDLWHVQVRFKSGAIGMLRASQCHTLSENYISVQCPRGSITTNHGDRQLRFKTVDGTETTVTEEELSKIPDGFFVEVKSWVDAIYDDTPMIVCAYDGRQAIAMVSAATESAQTGKPCVVK